MTAPGTLDRSPPRPHVEQPWRDDFALAARDHVDRAGAVLEHLLGDERHAVAADDDQAFRMLAPDDLGQVDHLWHVGEVVHAEHDGLGSERPQLTDERRGGFGLQVDEAHVVPGLEQCASDAFEAERFEPKEDLGVHQGARVHEQNSHDDQLTSAKETSRRRLSPFVADRSLELPGSGRPATFAAWSD